MLFLTLATLPVQRQTKTHGIFVNLAASSQVQNGTCCPTISCPSFLLLSEQQGLHSQQHVSARSAKTGVSIACRCQALAGAPKPSRHRSTFPVKFSGECPTTWQTCPENGPFRPHRCSHLVHLTLDEQPFGYSEAIMISQLPSLQSLCLTHPATLGALSEEIPEGHTLPALCMLTQLTHLSLTKWPTTDQAALSGNSLLTNLHSFSWNGDIRAAPWGSLSPLSSLKCLTLSGSRNRQPSLSEAGMTGLEVLDIAGTGWEGFWHILDSLTSVNSITKLICRDAGLLTPNLSCLHNFTALQHLVLDFKLRKPRPYCWDMLGAMTWGTKLDIGWI